MKLMKNVIGAFNGAASSTLVVGPRFGVDVSVLRLNSRKVMITSCDPISYIPSIGPEASASMSVYEVASDVATSGITPKYAMVDLNLPPQLSDMALTQYWKSFHKTCVQLGISIVGGHTGRFEGCDYSVVGGATLWAFCDVNDYVTSMMARDGDDIVMTKTAGYGATSVLTKAFPRTMRRVLGSSLFEEAEKYFESANIVKDATIASKCGIHSAGVTAMHDATEGGIVAGLLEVAEASRLGGTVFLDDIPISEETVQLCKFFHIDPMVSLGEGSLLITCRPHRTETILRRLRSGRIGAVVIGRLSAKNRTLRALTKRGVIPLRYPKRDPYWRAYWRGVEKGWA